MKIYINEQQVKSLFEAKMDGFDVNVLAVAKSFKERVEYCKKMLGFPIGNGSSRMVFQLDDETCLKLAKNAKGIAQNKEETMISLDRIISYVPKVYDGSDEENGLWIITQYVLPAKKEDFRRVLGVDFNDVANFAINTDRRFMYGSYLSKIGDRITHELYEKYENNDDVIDLFNDIHELKADYNQCVADLSGIRNWGMVSDNGEVSMVMLDIGLSEEVYNQYYKRRL